MNSSVKLYLCDEVKLYICGEIIDCYIPFITIKFNYSNYVFFKRAARRSVGSQGGPKSVARCKKHGISHCVVNWGRSMSSSGCVSAEMIM